MNDEVIKETEIKLKGKKINAQVNEKMPFLLKEMARGITHKEIVSYLIDTGIQINLHTFRTILYRYKEKNSKVEQKNDSTRTREEKVPISNLNLEESEKSEESNKNLSKAAQDMSAGMNLLKYLKEDKK